MTWKEDLSWGKQQASFNGAKFWIDQHEWVPSRRTIVHKIPGQEYAFVQDLGRDTNEWEIRAFVFGDEYNKDRDAMVAALTKKGSGELVHPFHGIKRVAIIGKPRVSEDKNKLGYASISFTAIEVGGARTFERKDVAGHADISAQRAYGAAGERFVQRFRATTIDRRTIGLLKNAASKVQAIDFEIKTALNIVDDGVSQLANLSGALVSLVATPTDLVNTLGDALTTTVNSVAGVLVTANQTANSFITGSFLDVLLAGVLGPTQTYGDDFDPVTRGSEEGDREADNQDALIELMRIGLLMSAARSALVTPPDNRSQARTARNAFVDSIREAQLTSDDNTYQELASLSADLVTFYDGVAGTLPEVGTFTPGRPMPAVLAAHVLYGDATRETEIIQRNNPPDPNFLEGPIEVLIDGR